MARSLKIPVRTSGVPRRGVVSRETKELFPQDLYKTNTIALTKEARPAIEQLQSVMNYGADVLQTVENLRQDNQILDDLAQIKAENTAHLVNELDPSKMHTDVTYKKINEKHIVDKIAFWENEYLNKRKDKAGWAKFQNKMLNAYSKFRLDYVTSYVNKVKNETIIATIKGVGMIHLPFEDANGKKTSGVALKIQLEDRIRELEVLWNNYIQIKGQDLPEGGFKVHKDKLIRRAILQDLEEQAKRKGEITELGEVDYLKILSEISHSEWKAVFTMSAVADGDITTVALPEGIELSNDNKEELKKEIDGLYKDQERRKKYKIAALNKEASNKILTKIFDINKGIAKNNGTIDENELSLITSLIQEITETQFYGGDAEKTRTTLLDIVKKMQNGEQFTASNYTVMDKIRKRIASNEYKGLHDLIQHTDGRSYNAWELLTKGLISMDDLNNITQMLTNPAVKQYQEKLQEAVDQVVKFHARQLFSSEYRNREFALGLFASLIRKSIQAGIDDGKLLEDLIDPGHKDYINKDKRLSERFEVDLIEEMEANLDYQFRKDKTKNAKKWREVQIKKGVEVVDKRGDLLVKIEDVWKKIDSRLLKIEELDEYFNKKDIKLIMRGIEK